MSVERVSPRRAPVNPCQLFAASGMAGLLYNVLSILLTTFALETPRVKVLFRYAKSIASVVASLCARRGARLW